MSIFQIILLAVVQGLAELLPVSSSAHVVVAEKLMGLDPSAPDMTLLLVMLHTGTMFAVIAYFWRSWKATYFASRAMFQSFLVRLICATVLTGIVGEILKKAIEKTLFRGAPKAEIELLFSRLDLIAPALAAAGLLILIAGILEKQKRLTETAHSLGRLLIAFGGYQGMRLCRQGPLQVVRPARFTRKMRVILQAFTAGLFKGGQGDCCVPRPREPVCQVSQGLVACFAHLNRKRSGCERQYRP